MLSKYIKTLQMSHTNEFTLDCRDKKKSRLLTNCIQLLDMNDLHNLRSIVDYANMDRDKLLQ